MAKVTGGSIRQHFVTKVPALSVRCIDGVHSIVDAYTVLKYSTH